MRISSYLILVFCAALALSGLPTQPAQAETPALDYVSGEISIGWKPEGGFIPAGPRPAALTDDRDAPAWRAAVQKLRVETGLRVLDAQPAYGTALLAVSPGTERAEIARLRRLPWVAYAEPNYLAHAADRVAAGPVYPADPSFSEQWNMRRIGAPEAWGLTLGSSTITVALLDSGIDRSHPEFAGRLLPGWDYVNGDNDPSDDFGHGTHVAGVMAAAMNNAQGVAGLAPRSRILPLKVLDSSGGGSYDQIATAIRRAADAGAQVINLSLGGPLASQNLQDAVNYALARQPVGALVVAAMGNCGQGGALCPGVNPDIYPAAYPGVLAVAASDHFDGWAPYSGYKSYVGIAAPGGLEPDRIWSTLPGGIYGGKHGTSMAAPLVSAAAALVWTLQPAASYNQVANILKETADKVGVNPQTGQPLDYSIGRNNYFGAGRLNVGKAVRWAYPPALAPITEPQIFLLDELTEQRTRQLALENLSGQAVWWQASVSQGGSWLKLSPETGTAAYAAPGLLRLQVTRGALPVGSYFGTVRVQTLFPAGAPSFDLPVTLRISASARRNYLPDMRLNSAGEGWRDPFAPDVTDRQLLNLANDSAQQLTLPFRTSFYGGNFRTLWVSDNGLVTFGAAPPATAPAGPAACPPSAADPNNALYVLASDWRPDLGGQVYAHRADADTYVITWFAMMRAGGGTGQSFQLALRRDGALAAIYLAVEPPAQSIVAAENWDGTVAQTIWCNGVGRRVGAGETVAFWPVLPW